MTKITTTNLANLENQTTAVATVNANTNAIVAALDNTLSRDGTTPNQMLSSLDMNSNRILNLPRPNNNDEPVRLIDLTNATLGTDIVGELSTGWIDLRPQTSTPASPSDGTRIFATSAGEFSWKEAADNKVRTVSSVLSADRVYTLPDADDTFVFKDFTQTLTGKTISISNNTITGLMPTDAPTFTGANLNPTTGTTNSGLNITQTGPNTGSQTSFQYNNIIVTDGSHIAPTVGQGTAFYIEHDIQSNSSGQKFALYVNIIRTQATNADGDLIAGVFLDQAAVSAGGTAATDAGAKGTMYAINPIASLTAGATNYSVIAGGEFDVGISAGASAANRFGVSIVSFGPGQGAVRDTAIDIAGNWLNLIQLTTLRGNTDALASTASIIAADDTASHTIGSIINLPHYTVTDWIINTPAFSISGAGTVNAGQGNFFGGLPLTLGSDGANLGTIRFYGLSGGFLTLQPGAGVLGGVLSLPAITDTLVARTTTDTLTNKTLTSPTLTTPQLGAATATSLTFSPTTNGIVGTTTNDNASTGYVGEYKETIVLVASAVSLTTGTPATVTSVSLGAGDWDVSGNVVYNYAATTTVSYEFSQLNTSAATVALSDVTTAARAYVPTTITPGGAFSAQAVGTQRFSLAAPATIYLNTRSTFGTSTAGAYGVIRARRVR